MNYYKKYLKYKNKYINLKNMKGGAYTQEQFKKHKLAYWKIL